MPRSPYAGCAIFIIGAIIICFTLGVGAYSLFQQNKIIAGFTVAEKKPAATLDAALVATAAPHLQQRLQQFRHQLEQPGLTNAELRLSVEDLNVAIGHFATVQDYRQQLWITGMADGQIHADFCRTLNGMPGSGTLRYLHGQLSLRPQIVDQQIQFKVTHMRSAVGQVPEEFIAQFPPYVLFETESQNPGIAALVARLSDIEVAEGQLIVRRAPKAAGSKESIDHGIRRLLRVLAVGFITVAGLSVFISLMAKKRKERRAQNETHSL